MSESADMSSNIADARRDAADPRSAAASGQAETTPPAGQSAGALLRQARQAMGLHIGALAVALKVPQRKLEALEADQYEELTDATFVRALAQAMCRALKVDPAPVLALLPHSLNPKLDKVANGLNQPFRDRPGRDNPRPWAVLWRPGPLIALALLVAAAAVYLAPAGSWSDYFSGPGAADVLPQPAPAASATSEQIFPPNASEVVPGAQTEAVVDAAPAAASAAAPTLLAATTVDALQLHAVAQTWVEVIDANGQVLVSRNLAAGEDLGLDGAKPLKLNIGNAAGVTLRFRGQAVDLAPHTSANVARFELK